MAGHGLQCPVCGRIDQTQRVSAIVSSQSRRGQYGFPGSQTFLASRLAPPMAPAGPTDSGCLAITMWVGLGFFLVAFAMGAISSAGTRNTDAMCLGAAALACVVVLWLYQAQRSTRKRMLRAEAAGRVPAWQRAMEVWERLYYCERDDVVFDPVTGQSFPVDYIQQYIYSTDVAVDRF